MGGFGGRGGVEGGSVEGGREEFLEFWFSRASSASILRACSSITFCCAAMIASSTAMRSRHAAWTSSDPLSIHPLNPSLAKKTRVIDNSLQNSYSP